MNIERIIENVRRKLVFRMDKDDDDEKTKKTGGNTRLVYGLCKGVGIDTTGMSPAEAWEAYTGKTGISAEKAFEQHFGSKKESGPKSSGSKTYKLGENIPKEVKSFELSGIGKLKVNDAQNDKTWGHIFDVTDESGQKMTVSADGHVIDYEGGISHYKGEVAKENKMIAAATKSIYAKEEGSKSLSSSFKKSPEFEKEEAKNKSVVKKVKGNIDKAMNAAEDFKKYLVKDDGYAKSFDDLSIEQKAYVNDINKVINRINETEKNIGVDGAFRKKVLNDLQSMRKNMEYEYQSLSNDGYDWESGMAKKRNDIVFPLIDKYVEEYKKTFS